MTYEDRGDEMGRVVFCVGGTDSVVRNEERGEGTGDREDIARDQVKSMFIGEKTLRVALRFSVFF